MYSILRRIARHYDDVEELNNIIYNDFYYYCDKYGAGLFLRDWVKFSADSDE